MFCKILIANRGEIAVRIIQTCREMGIQTVAVFSDVDRASSHVLMADEAVYIGPSPAKKSYLAIDRILDAASKSKADAIHPGYGFLSENPAFAKACQTQGVTFIGPNPQAMLLMGSKLRARTEVALAGVPIVPGASSPIGDDRVALSTAREIGFPVMLKATAGGGGMGMRLVNSPNQWEFSLGQARSEARAAFGDDTVYIEKALDAPRHVEVQILADEYGQIIHLGERECSLQRRHQKVLEETPSPLVDTTPSVRQELTAAAIAAAKAASYSNAGTVEFLMDRAQNFYFLEMNTRLQVEHPITELVTGLDLVKEQILIAAGEPLRYSQQDIRANGCAIECRIYAEDSAAGFLPSPGVITSISQPSGPGVRVDSGVYAGWQVPIEYDPLIAKLAVWAPTRSEAIARLRIALQDYRVTGISTTIDFFRKVVDSPEFCAGETDTCFIERLCSTPTVIGNPPEDENKIAILTAGLSFQEGATRSFTSRPGRSTWHTITRQASFRG